MVGRTERHLQAATFGTIKLLGIREGGSLCYGLQRRIVFLRLSETFFFVSEPTFGTGCRLFVAVAFDICRALRFEASTGICVTGWATVNRTEVWKHRVCVWECPRHVSNCLPLGSLFMVWECAPSLATELATCDNNWD